MRETAFWGVLIMVSVLMNGCIIVSSNKTQAPPKACTVPVPEANATIAEINAARALRSDSARLEIYEAIAKRPHLLPQERIHLIEESQKNLHSDSDRKKVLLILVNNHQPAPQPEPTQTNTTESPVPRTAEPENTVPKEAVSEK